MAGCGKKFEFTFESYSQFISYIQKQEELLYNGDEEHDLLVHEKRKEFEDEFNDISGISSVFYTEANRKRRFFNKAYKIAESGVDSESVYWSNLHNKNSECTKWDYFSMKMKKNEQRNACIKKVNDIVFNALRSSNVDDSEYTLNDYIVEAKVKLIDDIISLMDKIIKDEDVEKLSDKWSAFKENCNDNNEILKFLPDTVFFKRMLDEWKNVRENFQYKDYNKETLNENLASLFCFDSILGSKNGLKCDFVQPDTKAIIPYSYNLSFRTNLRSNHEEDENQHSKEINNMFHFMLGNFTYKNYDPFATSYGNNRLEEHKFTATMLTHAWSELVDFVGNHKDYSIDLNTGECISLFEYYSKLKEGNERSSKNNKNTVTLSSFINTLFDLNNGRLMHNKRLSIETKGILSRLSELTSETKKDGFQSIKFKKNLTLYSEISRQLKDSDHLGLISANLNHSATTIGSLQELNERNSKQWYDFRNKITESFNSISKNKTKLIDNDYTKIDLIREDEKLGGMYKTVISYDNGDINFNISIKRINEKKDKQENEFSIVLTSGDETVDLSTDLEFGINKDFFEGLDGRKKSNNIFLYRLFKNIHTLEYDTDSKEFKTLRKAEEILNGLTTKIYALPSTESYLSDTVSEDGEIDMTPLQRTLGFNAFDMRFHNICLIGLHAYNIQDKFKDYSDGELKNVVLTHLGKGYGFGNKRQPTRITLLPNRDNMLYQKQIVEQIQNRIKRSVQNVSTMATTTDYKKVDVTTTARLMSEQDVYFRMKSKSDRSPVRNCWLYKHGIMKSMDRWRELTLGDKTYTPDKLSPSDMFMLFTVRGIIDNPITYSRTDVNDMYCMNAVLSDKTVIPAMKIETDRFLSYLYAIGHEPAFAILDRKTEDGSFNTGLTMDELNTILKGYEELKPANYRYDIRQDFAEITKAAERLRMLDNLAYLQIQDENIILDYLRLGMYHGRKYDVFDVNDFLTKESFDDNGTSIAAMAKREGIQTLEEYARYISLNVDYEKILKSDKYKDVFGDIYELSRLANEYNNDPTLEKRYEQLYNKSRSTNSEEDSNALLDFMKIHDIPHTHKNTGQTVIMPPKMYKIKCVPMMISHLKRDRSISIISGTHISDLSLRRDALKMYRKDKGHALEYERYEALNRLKSIDFLLKNNIRLNHANLRGINNIGESGTKKDINSTWELFSKNDWVFGNDVILLKIDLGSNVMNITNKNDLEYQWVSPNYADQWIDVHYEKGTDGKVKVYGTPSGGTAEKLIPDNHLAFVPYSSDWNRKVYEQYLKLNYGYDVTGYKLNPILDMARCLESSIVECDKNAIIGASFQFNKNAKDADVSLLGFKVGEDNPYKTFMLMEEGCESTAQKRETFRSSPEKHHTSCENGVPMVNGMRMINEVVLDDEVMKHIGVYGDSFEILTNNGVIHSNSIMRFFRDNSLGSDSSSNVSNKPYVSSDHADMGVSTVNKCADEAFSNIKILNSKYVYQLNKYLLSIKFSDMAKKMFVEGNIDKNALNFYLNEAMDRLNDAVLDKMVELFKHYDGYIKDRVNGTDEIMQVLNSVRNEDGTITITWGRKNVYPITALATSTVSINTPFDIWEALGGTKSCDVSGKINDSSNSYAAEILSAIDNDDALADCDTDVMKMSMIHIGATGEATKYSQANKTSMNAMLGDYTKEMEKEFGPDRIEGLPNVESMDDLNNTLNALTEEIQKQETSQEDRLKYNEWYEKLTNIKHRMQFNYTQLPFHYAGVMGSFGHELSSDDDVAIATQIIYELIKIGNAVEVVDDVKYAISKNMDGSKNLLSDAIKNNKNIHAFLEKLAEYVAKNPGLNPSVAAQKLSDAFAISKISGEPINIDGVTFESDNDLHDLCINISSYLNKKAVRTRMNGFQMVLLPTEKCKIHGGKFRFKYGNDHNRIDQKLASIQEKMTGKFSLGKKDLDGSLYYVFDNEHELLGIVRTQEEYDAIVKDFGDSLYFTKTIDGYGEPRVYSYINPSYYKIETSTKGKGQKYKLLDYVGQNKAEIDAYRADQNVKLTKYNGRRMSYKITNSITGDVKILEGNEDNEAEITAAIEDSDTNIVTICNDNNGSEVFYDACELYIGESYKAIQKDENGKTIVEDITINDSKDYFNILYNHKEGTVYVNNIEKGRDLRCDKYIFFDKSGNKHSLFELNSVHLAFDKKKYILDSKKDLEDLEKNRSGLLKRYNELLSIEQTPEVLAEIREVTDKGIVIRKNIDSIRQKRSDSIYNIYSYLNGRSDITIQSMMSKTESENDNYFLDDADVERYQKNAFNMLQQAINNDIASIQRECEVDLFNPDGGPYTVELTGEFEYYPAECAGMGKYHRKNIPEVSDIEPDFEEKFVDMTACTSSDDSTIFFSDKKRFESFLQTLGYSMDNMPDEVKWFDEETGYTYAIQKVNKDGDAENIFTVNDDAELTAEYKVVRMLEDPDFGYIDVDNRFNLVVTDLSNNQNPWISKGELVSVMINEHSTIAEDVKNVIVDKVKVNKDNIIAEINTATKMLEYTFCSRTPSQMKSSGMVMRNVDDFGDSNNNIYVSPLQLLLHGSDFDIDKITQLLFNCNKNGTIKYISKFGKGRTMEEMEASLGLPCPKNEHSTIAPYTMLKEWVEESSTNSNVVDMARTLIDSIHKRLGNENASVNAYDAKALLLAMGGSDIALFGRIVREIDRNKQQIVYKADVTGDKDYADMIANMYCEYNKQENYNQDGLNNFIIYNIMKVYKNPDCYSEIFNPIDYATRLQTLSKQSIAKRDGGCTNCGQLGSLIEYLYKNAQGKTGVSIGANSNKALYATISAVLNAANSNDISEIEHVLFDVSTKVQSGNKKEDYRNRNSIVEGRQFKLNLEDIKESMEPKKFDDALYKLCSYQVVNPLTYTLDKPTEEDISNRILIIKKAYEANVSKLGDSVDLTFTLRCVLKGIYESIPDNNNNRKNFEDKLKFFLKTSYEAVLGYKHRTTDTLNQESIKKLVNSSVNSIIHNENDAYWNSFENLATMSEVISEAVDNAKNSTLGQLNAGTETLGLYTFAIMLGYDVKKIYKIMTSQTAKIVVEVAKGSCFNNETSTSIENIIKNDNQVPIPGFAIKEQVKDILKNNPRLRTVQNGDRKTFAQTDQEKMTDFLRVIYRNTQLKSEFLTALTNLSMSNSTNKTESDAIQRYIAKINGFIYMESIRKYEPDTYNMIAFFARGAKEAQFVTSMFSPSKELKVMPVDRVKYFNDMNNVFKDADSNIRKELDTINSEMIERNREIIDDANFSISEGMIAFEMIAIDGQYLEDLTNLYDKLKAKENKIFNPFYILHSNKHYESSVMIQCMCEIILKKLSKRYEITSNLYKEISEDKAVDKDKVYKTISSVLDVAISNEFLKTLGPAKIGKGFTLRMESKNKDYSEYKDYKFSEDFNVTLGTGYGNLIFKQYLEEELFGRMINGTLTYKKNGNEKEIDATSFAKYLTYINEQSFLPKTSDVGRYSLAVNLVDNEFGNELQSAFSSICDKKTNITIDGKELTIHEALYLYNMIVDGNKNTLTSFYKLLNINNHNDSLLKQYNDSIEGIVRSFNYNDPDFVGRLKIMCLPVVSYNYEANNKKTDFWYYDREFDQYLLFESHNDTTGTNNDSGEGFNEDQDPYEFGFVDPDGNEYGQEDEEGIKPKKLYDNKNFKWKTHFEDIFNFSMLSKYSYLGDDGMTYIRPSKRGKKRIVVNTSSATSTDKGLEMTLDSIEIDGLKYKRGANSNGKIQFASGNQTIELNDVKMVFSESIDNESESLENIQKVPNFEPVIAEIDGILSNEKNLKGCQ